MKFSINLITEKKMFLKTGEFLKSPTIYVAVAIFFFNFVSSDLVVQTSSGPIQGVTSRSGDVEAFLGIPFAEPPTGNLRFAKPVPKKPWTEIFIASELPPPCLQFSLEFEYYYMPDITNMSEDCLYLNVWAPKPLLNDTLKPVIVLLHQGAFIWGASSMKAYDGTNFASRNDIIVATINYRLGAFGYLLAYIKEADGNMGMYDQLMAMKWVKENAIHFGGDPRNIVLMGESAGSISIAAHMLSPLSKNLFHKVILQSGSIILHNFFENNTILFRNSHHIASASGCSNQTVNLDNNPHSVINCLKNQSVETILEAQKSLLTKSLLCFFPRINDDFLPQIPIELLRERKFNKDVPVLAGFNNDEGTMFIIGASPEYFGLYGNGNVQTVGKNFAHSIVKMLAKLINLSNRSNISKLWDFYLSQLKNRTSEGYTKLLADIVGDIGIVCNMILQADYFSINGNSVYFYKFRFRAASTPMAEWVGVTHLDELQYIFGNPYHKNFTEEEEQLSRQLMDRWSAFARTGNPNVPGELPWLRYTYDNPFYLSFDQEGESIRMKPLERCEFVRKLFKYDIPTKI